MDFVGIDLHKTSSQVCLLSEDGALTERRIKSTRASFDEIFANRPLARILVEASTESEWVADILGHSGEVSRRRRPQRSNHWHITVFTRRAEQTGQRARDFGRPLYESR